MTITELSDAPPLSPQQNQTTRMQIAIDAACQKACNAIAPAWPLDRSIAVNPHWGRVSQPVRTVAARLAVLGGLHVLPNRSIFQEAWQSQRINPSDLQRALHKVAPAMQGQLNEAACVAALQDGPHIAQLPLLIDLLDVSAKRDKQLPWRQAVTHQVSQTCAAYFDRSQADWRPAQDQGLYAFWRDTLVHDHGIGILMGMPHMGKSLGQLPQTAAAAEQWALAKFNLPEAVWAEYLEALLLTVNGWASWCAYLQWQAQLQGAQDSHLRELLAIRLAWGAILLEGCSSDIATTAFAELRHRWSGVQSAFSQAEDALLVDEVWQHALELGYQNLLALQLQNGASETGAAQPPAEPQAQAVFCIDVRSEPLRRAIEAANTGIQTVGFAGFFGLPIAYTPIGTTAQRPQLPGLLAPAMQVSEVIVQPTGSSASLDVAALTSQRQRNMDAAEQWGHLTQWPGSAFSFVEAVGLAYGKKVFNWLRTAKEERARNDLNGIPKRWQSLCRPTLLNLALDERVRLAAQILHAMGLDRKLAPWVCLFGHGSQSANNPHAAGLECGACGGQTGEANARVLARLLNDPEVRKGLQAHLVFIPDSTTFIAALHNTTTDELEWFDTDLVPQARQVSLAKLQADFTKALGRVRAERAPALGLDAGMQRDALLAALQHRASDGAQTRPEWGLAGNAAFLIAPRALSKSFTLRGRAFLHDYDFTQDGDNSILELLMTAPMLVTHWINWQYHASTCEPRSFGSGNKVLHNVVGGNIGVFEGNGGDLRIGLSKQSLHDGNQWVHEPLRLTVVIAAPQERIEAILNKHKVVRDLVHNGWLHLWQLQDARIASYDCGRWNEVSAGRA
jgi:hypothetical protein